MVEIGTYYNPLDADIIIIGAGVSGMSAAYTLFVLEPSLNVIILEAANKIGGRTFSTPNNTLYDLGGQWISSQQNLLVTLLKHLEIATKGSNPYSKNIIDYNGKIIKKRRKNLLGFCSLLEKLELTAFIIKIELLCKKDSLDENLASMSMEQYITANVPSSFVKALLRSIILTHCGIETSHLTLGFYIFFCTSTHGFTNQLISAERGLHEMWIENGAQEICNKIADAIGDEIRISTSTEVISIKKSDHQIEVKTTNNTYYSRNVIMAIPSSKILEIDFSPPLSPSKMNALHNAIEGELMKFVAIYKIAFWNIQNISGDIYVIEGYNQERPLVRCYGVTIENKPALSGLTLKILDKNDLKSRILQQLSQYFGNLALTPLDFLAKEWLNGSPMSCYTSIADVLEINKNDARIFWAGAEASLEWFGTIAGGVCAGHKAAGEVLYDLRPGSLTMETMSFFRISLGEIRNRPTINQSIYKKIMTPYYVITAFGVFLILVKMWRAARMVLFKH